jgi:phenylacetate-CoA ligase
MSRPEIEFAPIDKIRKFQEGKLHDVLEYLSLYSPFYQKLFKKYSIKNGSVQHIEDLVKIPPTTKDDLQKHNWEFLCVPRNKVTEYTSTSGTMGKPVTIALTVNDLERLAYNECISFACAGGTSEDIFQLMLTLDRQFMAGIAYYQGIRKLGASIIRVGPGLPAMQLDAIERLKPTVLVAVPSFLVKLVEYAQQHSINLNNSAVTRAICIGESVRTENFELGIIGRKIRESWQIDLHSTYASTEMQTAFTECEHAAGGHHHPELIIIELLNDDSEPVEDGQPGEVTITTLGVEGMPLLRYKTGDIAVAYTEPCKCGRTTLRLGPIIGRKQQLIKLKGTTLYPPGVFEILNELPFIQDYVVEAFLNELGTDDLRLHVLIGETGETDEEEALRKLSMKFQSRIRVVPKINITTHAELEKLQFGKGERKVRRFVDNRQ